MKKVYINISTLSYRNDTVPSYLAWTTLVISVAVFFTVVSVFVIQDLKLSDYEDNLELIKRKVIEESVEDMSPKELRRIAKEVQVVNGLIEKESYSWVRLLTAIEGAVPKNVFITDVDTDLYKGRLFLSGIARGSSEVNNFIDKLNASPDFEKAVPGSQTHIGKGAYGAETTAFSIKAVYIKEAEAIEAEEGSNDK